MVDSDVFEQEDYEVKIGSFNGPMDLLVYLVQKKEMTLDQIPIAEIADDFLKWVNEYSETDLSKAGDFLFMASRLMALKVQELLPAEERTEDGVIEYNEDREKLMQEMLEYQRFKQVAGGLQEMEAKNFGTYSRGRLEKTQSDEDTLADANIWQLFRAYQKSLKTKISETIHHIELDYVTIQDRQQAINNFLNVHGRALFEDLLDNDSHPIVAAVTFMAMLEMIKTDDIVFRQSELFGPIWIYRKKNNPEYAEEMAHETVFFSKDPEVKAGLVETIRSQAIARSKEKSVGDLAATMREAVLWTERGRNVTDEDLNAMLEGREDISEVQENPFADMIAEADAAEGITSEPQTSEQAPATGDATTPINESATVPINSDATNPASGGVATAVNEESANSGDTTNETSAESATSARDVIANEFVETVSATTPSHTFEPVDEEFADASDVPNEEINEAQSEEIGEEFVDDENSDIDIPVIRSTNSEEHSVSAEANFQGLNEESVQQMSDEEFAAFMQKAQAFYDNASTKTAPTSAQSSPAQPATNATSFTTNSTSVSGANNFSSHTTAQKEEPEEDKYSSYSFGNEMTDEEYIAYLNRSARASRKEEPKPTPADSTPNAKTQDVQPAAKPATVPEKKKSERKSFMPEDDEGGMTEEEYLAYLAEHGDDDDEEEGPVVYGAGKD